MLSSMTPQRTSIVEFPVAEVGEICTIRRIEQTVVNNPRRKTPQRASFLLSSMLRFSRSGMGRKKMMTSKLMVTAARP